VLAQLGKACLLREDLGQRRPIGLIPCLQRRLDFAGSGTYVVNARTPLWASIQLDVKA
jgi:hypothetical protein